MAKFSLKLFKRRKTNHIYPPPGTPIHSFKQSKFATSSPIFSDIVPCPMTIIRRHKKVFISGELSSPSRNHSQDIANYFFSNTSSIVFLAIMHSFSKLSTVIYFLQIILYRKKTKVSYFTLSSGAFGFAIVFCRYNDENKRICKMTKHLCWHVGKKKMSGGS